MSLSFHPSLADLHDPQNPVKRSPVELQKKLAHCEVWERPEVALRHCLLILDRHSYSSTRIMIEEEVLRCMPTACE